jgi:hypothetical protein
MQRPTEGVAPLDNVGVGELGVDVDQEDTMTSVDVDEQQEDSCPHPLEDWRLNSLSGANTMTSVKVDEQQEDSRPRPLIE